MSIGNQWNKHPATPNDWTNRSRCSKYHDIKQQPVPQCLLWTAVEDGAFGIFRWSWGSPLALSPSPLKVSGFCPGNTPFSLLVSDWLPLISSCGFCPITASDSVRWLSVRPFVDESDGPETTIVTLLASAAWQKHWKFHGDWLHVNIKWNVNEQCRQYRCTEASVRLWRSTLS